MKNLLGLSLIFMLVNTPIAIADDTEIFTGTSNSGGGMNAIFLLDTSGSMSKLEEIKGFEDYVSSTMYQHSEYGFNSSSHYIFRSGAINDLLELSTSAVSYTHLTLPTNREV